MKLHLVALRINADYIVPAKVLSAPRIRYELHAYVESEIVDPRWLWHCHCGTESPRTFLSRQAAEEALDCHQLGSACNTEVWAWKEGIFPAP